MREYKTSQHKFDDRMSVLPEACPIHGKVIKKENSSPRNF